MSEKNTSETAVRGEEPELNDEALEQVAGGCQIDQSVQTYNTLSTLKPTPTFPAPY